VPFEDTVDGLRDSLRSTAVLRAPRALGAHVRRAGEDAHRGEVLVDAGERMGAVHVSGAYSAGATHALVARQPRVAVISTGDELVEPGLPQRRGQIPESNSRLLSALVGGAGGRVVLRTSATDDPEHLRRLVAEATGPLGADAIVLSGGVSAGAYEVVKRALADRMTFRSVAMQPGRPQGVGSDATGALLLGLPGTPASVAVSFEAFVRPALLRMQGRSALVRPTLALPTTQGWRKRADRQQYMPVVVDRGDPRAWTVSPVGVPGPHRARRMAATEAYAVVPVGVEAVSPGDHVEVMMLG
jgi:molybdopterin molybdotransferase